MTENQRLKEIRITLNLNQRNFCEALGIKQGSYSDVERGKTGISAIIIKSLIIKFHVNPLWLCEGKGEMFIGEKVGINIPFEEDSPQAEFPSDSEDEADSDNLSSESIAKRIEQQKHYIESIKGIIDFLKED